MTKYRYIYDGKGQIKAEYVNDELVFSRDDYEITPDYAAPMIMPDIQPYQSMIDGSLITSRSKHRDHLRQHNCIEIGNETKYLEKKELKSPPGLKQALIDVVNQKWK